MKVFQFPLNNVGDTLTKPIVEYFLKVNVEIVNHTISNKFLGVGSIIDHAFVQLHDTIWGSGLIQDWKPPIPECNIIALRGKNTAHNLGSDCKVFGDPALLLPLIYNPEIEKIHKIGIIEHYIDKGRYMDDGFRIDVMNPWKIVVDQIKSCEMIKSSSLHGLIISEAYGIPCEWIVLSNRVMGNGFKFRDYLSATDRTMFSEPFEIKPIQDNLLIALREYEKSNR